jgi:hypothetical protein
MEIRDHGGCTVLGTRWSYGDQAAEDVPYWAVTETMKIKLPKFGLNLCGDEAPNYVSSSFRDFVVNLACTWKSWGKL